MKESNTFAIGTILQYSSELEKRMAHLVESYHDEWAEVIKDPEKRKKFKQFVSTDESN